MDALSDPEIDTVIWMKSTQVGATELLGNIIGYYIHQDPAPILALFPNMRPLGEAMSKDRIAPMIRDSPALRDRVADAKGRDSGNTILHKTFPGGHLTIGGANTTAGLAARPIRILLADEVDRYPLDVGAAKKKEGNPFSLARKRTDNFWNRKIYACSTPTIRGSSLIERLWKVSDQRRYFVPCPHCGEFQHLVWNRDGGPGGVKWEKDAEGNHLPETAYYECEHCAGRITDGHKPDMLKRGEWRKTAPDRKTAGFHINAIYSPWVPFARMATEWLEAQNDPEELKTFVNTSLGEVWSEQTEKVDQAPLLARRETYPAQVPAGVSALTAGVDVQKNRLEVEVVGWGHKRESWGITYRIIEGDPVQPEVWRRLDALLTSTFRHESGVDLRIVATAVDSGYLSDEVYDFCGPRWLRRVYATKGGNRPDQPLTANPTRNNSRKVRLFTIGTTAAKDLIFPWLDKAEPGPGYSHFPLNDEYDEAYFKGLTAEEVFTEYRGGVEIRSYKKVRKRNEPLDLRVYAMAALKICGIDLDKAAARIAAEAQTRKSGARPAPVRGRRVINKGVQL